MDRAGAAPELRLPHGRDSTGAGTPAPVTPAARTTAPGTTALARRPRLASTIRHRVALSLLAVAAVGLSGCKIVPMAKKADPSAAPPATYADTLWDAKLLPHAQAKRAAIGDVLAAATADLDAAGAKYGYRANSEGAPWNFVVTGEGLVKAKDTQSQAGKLTLDLAPAPEPREVTIQIGPVVRGNALRDSMPFISFQDFTNQLDFAQAGRSLNDRAMAGIAKAAAGMEPGNKVRFTGAMTLSTAADRLLVTPIELERVEGAAQ